MKTVLLFGAGKSATVLIDYLIREAEINKWKFIIADSDMDQILSKTNNSRFAEAVVLDINNEDRRGALIARAHVVISMMPPNLHFMIAKDCVEYRKHLLTASYLDEQMKSLQDEIINRKLLFLCEMGLDPGIDHMSAMLLIDNIQKTGGKIKSFKSHCGGLIAPESDDNPWRYKISWNPRNVVLAGKAGASYKQDGDILSEKYESLFARERSIMMPAKDPIKLSYYPNRDSIAYIALYGLRDIRTFIRTTLRYPDFMYGWNKIIELNLTDETLFFESNGKTLKDFFKAHFLKNNIIDQADSENYESLTGRKELLEDILKVQLGNGNTEDVSLMNDKAALILNQLLFLGLEDDKTIIDKGLCSAADVLQFALETKLLLQPADKDLVVMVHEIDYERDGVFKNIRSSLVVKGNDGQRTAMAKTVGLPLGIAAKLILEGNLKIKGLHIPIIEAIYLPVLRELEKQGISFVEKECLPPFTP